MSSTSLPYPEHSDPVYAYGVQPPDPRKEDAKERAIERIVASPNSVTQCFEWTIKGTGGNQLGVFNFVGIIDHDIHWTKLDAYGNLEYNSQTINADLITKMKYQIAVKDFGNMFSYVSKWAKYAQDLLWWLERAQIEKLDANKSSNTPSPLVHSFVREDSETGDCYIILNTYPIVTSIPPKTTDQVGRQAIGSGIKGSPVKRVDKPAVGTILIDPRKLKLIHLRDPSDRFSPLWSQARDIPLSIPNIRDDKGILISARDYDQKLVHGQLVDIEGTLRLVASTILAMSRYDASPSTLFPSLISRMAPPGMSGSSLSPRNANSILGVSIVKIILPPPRGLDSPATQYHVLAADI
ncbi:hypothetical protein M422DRAFT_267164 [Sphaerobolus stellatus SS14]|uniref:Uncharacterized protein n=1 Tax=Sphaerobolus stellatus (strain SS14) TaxID=990650 RepID=A0A0C9V179_SPHS4|nr:hypothetical protein M422DRAFT_267164 [Sphaerobolus stellatus SS14]